jgi:hypothetical protein
MNAAERLWRALAEGDWSAARAQFHASAMIERFGAGPRSLLALDEYLAELRERAARGHEEIQLLRALNAGGVTIVIEARVGDARCAGIYDLHDGRIAGAVEYWG